MGSDVVLVLLLLYCVSTETQYSRRRTNTTSEPNRDTVQQEED